MKWLFYEIKKMRRIEELKSYWDSVHDINHLGALSGAEYAITISSMQVDNILKKGDNVLEIGVGLGYVTQGFRDAGFNISGLDISTSGLERVRGCCENVYSVDEITSLPSDYFDVIICANTIQHIPTYLLEIELPHIIRSLKPNGVLSMQFVSSNICEDTGIDEAKSDAHDWDDNIGCFCRSPELMESLIYKHGGVSRIMSSTIKDFSKEIHGAYLFHVMKRDGTV